jgi:hypothetical protein
MLFKPGRTPSYPDSWFTVDFYGRNLVWILDGRRATASRCSPYVLKRPFVYILRPADESIFNSWDDICIKAKACDRDGYITKVEFYDGEDLLAVDTNSPYCIRLEDPLIGVHLLTAIAYDNDGLTKTSNTVTVRVR